VIANFCKYSGCGNDFILMELPENQDLGKLALRLCERRLSIGADGLIFISPSEKAAFRVHFYNADGSEAEMCGNGLRSAVHFFLKDRNASVTVETKERLLGAEKQGNMVLVAMGEVKNIEHLEVLNLKMMSLNTGVPHAVHFVKDLSSFDLEDLGRKVRYHEAFAPQGTNFNIVEPIPEGIAIRTYERGVEGETLACGTGATAAAIAYSLSTNTPPPIAVKVLSGNFLTIDFEQDLSRVTMLGEAQEIFSGTIHLN